MKQRETDIVVICTSKKSACMLKVGSLNVNRLSLNFTYKYLQIVKIYQKYCKKKKLEYLKEMEFEN